MDTHESAFAHPESNVRYPFLYQLLDTTLRNIVTSKELPEGWRLDNVEPEGKGKVRVKKGNYNYIALTLALRDDGSICAETADCQRVSLYDFEVDVSRVEIDAMGRAKTGRQTYTAGAGSELLLREGDWVMREMGAEDAANLQNNLEVMFLAAS